MIDHYSIQKALRVKLQTLSVCTTGSVTLSVTATGYARTTGSFLTDGFVPGLEVSGTGFGAAGNNTAKTITSVSALTLTCPGCAVESATTATLACGLPSIRAWENAEPMDADGDPQEPVAGRPWVEEQYIPGPMQKTTLGALGQLEVLPIYAPKIYVPAGLGVGAARKYADALLTLFAPSTALTVANHTVVVGNVPAPYSGQLLQASPGWAVIPVTIPLRVRTASSA